MFQVTKLVCKQLTLVEAFDVVQVSDTTGDDSSNAVGFIERPL